MNKEKDMLLLRRITALSCHNTAIKISALLLTAIVTLFSAIPSARGTSGGYCVKGCGPLSTQITANLTHEENKTGYQINSQEIIGNYITINYRQGIYHGGEEWFIYPGQSIPAAGTIPSTWQFNKVDDYISVAIKEQDNCGGDASN
ncbi:hypothetical protein BL250_15980 [Erwinia sp. OLTSP20]|uniref:hypothetical protein n=1 Tax=unclassified Erwinia TaxID=2622719 RepID=UPI000C1982D2|nr:MULTISPECIES: hypothetical protein [unclassified Erwinia]PIJ49712.1 hypothetical protein BV501_10960 [Erwinia sp. OAMSP11]PIJ70810.1 hypothetical protein BK416_12150 [Erwinia sp. OLSSP12]PIJ80176.1 hypothetical protein BLD47_11015 [Erwinia sp. OLCASP19]PIJ82299.1 hypothetical protein BLD46_10765 [Erwinia sp. OLMTSP26]PIJ84986.1 hypothetical protein BLD49_10875 [Erwinia sp. OLMDSP33]